MSTHELKARVSQFERIARGEKRAEVTKADKDFQVGDTVKFIEVTAYGYAVTHTGERDKHGRFREPFEMVAVATVTHVLHHWHAEGVQDGYVVLSFDLKEVRP